MSVNAYVCDVFRKEKIQRASATESEPLSDFKLDGLKLVSNQGSSLIF